MVQIRNRLGALACAAALSLVGSAHATTFNLSYTFAPGGDGTIDTVTGTVQGNLVGTYVENLHGFNLFYDGIAFTGATSAFQLDGAGGFSTDPARLSTVASQNDLLVASDDGNFSFGFIANFDGAGTQLVFANDLNLVEHNAASDLGATSWSLTAAPIPEPAPLALMLAGIGLVGAAARRHRRHGGL
jgi:hypothetical protein